MDLRADYVRYRKRSPDNTKAGAQAYEATLRHRLARGESIISPPRGDAATPTFESFARTWFDDYVTANNKPSEQRTKHYVLRAELVPFFGKKVIGDITVRHIEQYKAHAMRSGVARKTINNRLTILNKCLRTAYEWLCLEGKPPHVTWLKCPPSRTDYLTHDESSRLLAHAEGRTYEMILMALRTGMRQGELNGLQWSSVNWQTGSIAVRHSRNDRTGELGSPKSNRERHIPMHRDVFDVLVRRREEAGLVFLDDAGNPFNHARSTVGWSTHARQRAYEKSDGTRCVTYSLRISRCREYRSGLCRSCSGILVSPLLCVTRTSLPQPFDRPSIC